VRIVFQSVQARRYNRILLLLASQIIIAGQHFPKQSDGSLGNDSVWWLSIPWLIRSLARACCRVSRSAYPCKFTSTGQT
jgi:hypothetical protein